MFGPRHVKLEKRIKDLNALMAEYRNEISEAERRFKKRDISNEEFDRVRSRCQAKMESISEKIRGVREELEKSGE